MKTTVSTIKVLFWITAISVILTIPLSFYNVYFGNWVAQWTNAILVGVFASSLVVLISEYVRYKHMKSSVESDLYYNLTLLYIKLKYTLSSTDQAYQGRIKQLTSSFLCPQTTEINDGQEKIRYGIIQYCTLHKNNISRNAKTFMLQTTPKLLNIISSLKGIEIAVNEDILDVYNSNLNSLRQYRCGKIDNYVEQQPIITATSSHTNLALQKVINLINDDLFNSIESFLLTISKSKSNNFDWEKDKERILKMV